MSIRLTKKLVREAKHSTINRLRKLREMSDDEFKAEVDRLNQSMNEHQIRGTQRELALFLAVDWLDRSIPDHWIM